MGLGRKISEAQRAFDIVIVTSWHWHEGWAGNKLSEPLPTYPGSSSGYEGGFPAGHHELFTTFSWDDQKVRRLFIRKVTISPRLGWREGSEGFAILCGNPWKELAQPLPAEGFPSLPPSPLMAPPDTCLEGLTLSSGLCRPLHLRVWHPSCPSACPNRPSFLVKEGGSIQYPIGRTGFK